jgi:hypothetical protein
VFADSPAPLNCSTGYFQHISGGIGDEFSVLFGINLFEKKFRTPPEFFIATNLALSAAAIQRGIYPVFIIVFNDVVVKPGFFAKKCLF